MRLGHTGPAPPPRRDEEHPHPRRGPVLPVVDDRAQSELVGTDAHPGLLLGLTRRALVQRLTFLQVSGGQVQHAVRVTGAPALQQEDPPRPVHDDVHVDDAAVPLGHGSLLGQASGEPMAW
ncbi:hypothetical protein GCM10007147_38400 [Nocardiopsis kunsanensis]|uniref:Uncharacterized protein n=1 Tax=Nocardiopsis kunsanensis TaxID=141693 RepID=A0A919CKL4_9ACTN|nr:hypothetical protein GCM10007147_38400 [Nocardiopsis kunsanensis]